jgi:hypothetical protein
MEMLDDAILNEASMDGWSEQRHQMALFQWARREIANGRKSLRMLVAIPNGYGVVTRRCSKQYDALGFRPGMADILYLWPTTKYHGLAIELKSLRPNARVSREQEEFLRELNEIGYRTKVCHGFRDAIQVINGYEHEH